MRNMIITIIIINFIVSILFLIVNRETTETITYFPIDQRLNIEQAFTSLQTTTMTNEQKLLLDWNIQSTTKHPLYLRQDVSLLYKNGYLLSIINQWQTNTSILREQRSFTISQNSILQSISFHHGEHHENDKITSVQRMTSDQLYIVCCKDSDKLTSFKHPDNVQMDHVATLLDEQVMKHLQQHWNVLIEYYKIQLDQYELIPLYELIRYNDNSLPQLSMSKTKAVIGQLWEGLYKNYILPLSKQKYFTNKNFMPLVLFDRKGTHLIVLYNINGKPEQLYQQIE